MKRTKAIEILSKAMKDAENCAACVASEDDYDRYLHHDLEEEAEAYKMAIRALGGATV